MKTSEDIGQSLRRLRRARGWTLAELARRAGTSAPTVHRYEGGWRRFEVTTLRKLATALGCRLIVRLEPPATPGRRVAGPVLWRRIDRLFWDRRPLSTDLARYPHWVVQRVLEYGSLADIESLWRFYGKEQFLDLVAGVHFSSAKTRRFWQLMLEQEGRPCTRRFSREEAAGFWIS